MRALAGGQVVFDVAAGGTASVAWRITLPNRDELAGELATLRVRGVGPSTCLPGMDLPIRLVAGKVVEFAANSRVERQYLYQADHSGSSESLRFGSEFGYLFDVGAARSARLRINVGRQRRSTLDRASLNKRSRLPQGTRKPIVAFLAGDLARQVPGRVRTASDTVCKNSRRRLPGLRSDTRNQRVTPRLIDKKDLQCVFGCGALKTDTMSCHQSQPRGLLRSTAGLACPPDQRDQRAGLPGVLQSLQPAGKHLVADPH